MTAPAPTVRVNLGSGPDYRPGWLNVDVDPAVRADLTCAVTDYGQLNHALTGTVVQLIYMKHVLEHLPIAAVQPHLAWCRAMLAVDGWLVVDGPDLRAMCARLATKPAWDWDDVRMIYGGQCTPWDEHKAGWGPDFLGALFETAGFVDVQYRSVDLCFVMQGRKGA